MKSGLKGQGRHFRALFFFFLNEKHQLQSTVRLSQHGKKTRLKDACRLARLKCLCTPFYSTDRNMKQNTMGSNPIYNCIFVPKTDQCYPRVAWIALPAILGKSRAWQEICDSKSEKSALMYCFERPSSYCAFAWIVGLTNLAQ